MKVGAPAPDVTLQVHTGETIRLADLRGKPSYYSCIQKMSLLSAHGKYVLFGMPMRILWMQVLWSSG